MKNFLITITIINDNKRKSQKKKFAKSYKSYRTLSTTEKTTELNCHIKDNVMNYF
jgi:hypothetical protein